MVQADLTQPASKLFAAAVAKFPKEARAAVEAVLKPFDPDAEIEAWFARHAPVVKKKKPGAELSLIGFGALMVPLKSDEDNVFIDVFVGGDEEEDALAIDGLAYGAYDPYPPLGERFSPMMTEAYRTLVEAEEGEEEYFALSQLFAQCCAARMCRELPDLIRGGSPLRYIIAGENECAELVGAVTAAGWVPMKPGEKNAAFAKRIAG